MIVLLSKIPKHHGTLEFKGRYECKINYFFTKKSIARSTMIADIATPRFEFSSLRVDFTTEERKLVAKWSILFTGLFSGLVLHQCPEKL